MRSYPVEFVFDQIGNSEVMHSVYSVFVMGSAEKHFGTVELYYFQKQMVAVAAAAELQQAAELVGNLTLVFD